MKTPRFALIILMAMLFAGCCKIIGPECCPLAQRRGLEISDQALLTPDDEAFPPQGAKKFYKHATGNLAPVYSLLAEQIVEDYALAQKAGIGIDIGGGPGDLVMELAKRTGKMYWINADINPHNFPYLYRRVTEAGLGHRVGAIFADALAMPFREDYADIVVSRGTFQFWSDQEAAFSEIYRVLKPGGVAYIGRGLPDAMPGEDAQALRKKHGSGPKYSVSDTEARLRKVMKACKIQDYRIHIHKDPEYPEVNYGIWLEIRK
ncbi:MAG: class I SAM-dependent methyltransferase [Candidatus Sumerlaeia bacterium]